MTMINSLDSRLSVLAPMAPIPHAVASEVLARCASLVALRTRTATPTVHARRDDIVSVAATVACAELAAMPGSAADCLTDSIPAREAMLSACRKACYRAVKDAMDDDARNRTEVTADDEGITVAENVAVRRGWSAPATDVIAADSLRARLADIISALTPNERDVVRAILATDAGNGWTNGLPSAATVARLMGASTSGPSRMRVKAAIVATIDVMRELAEYSLTSDPIVIRSHSSSRRRNIAGEFPSNNPITYPGGRFGNRPVSSATIAVGVKPYHPTAADRVADGFAEATTPSGPVAKISRNAGKRAGSIGCSMTYARTPWSGKAS